MDWPRAVAVDSARIVASVSAPRAALLPLLVLAQRHWGWVPPDWIAYAADLTGVPRERVMSMVASLSALRQEAVGRHTVALCGGLTCRLMGGRAVADFVRSRLGIGWGETTPDGRVTLVRVDCQGACSTAPTMLVDGRLYTGLTLEDVSQLLQALS